jgi:Fe-S-cluster containining protein
MRDIRTEFERTTCACDECRSCCKRQPGPLGPGDFDRIRDHLQITTRIALTFFWSSPGAVVQNKQTHETRMIGTVTPRMRGGRCVFLNEDERCSIHSVAPFGCAFFDMHQSADESNPRSLALLNSIVRDTQYQILRDILPPAESWRPV